MVTTIKITAFQQFRDVRGNVRSRFLLLLLLLLRVVEEKFHEKRPASRPVVILGWDPEQRHFATVVDVIYFLIARLPPPFLGLAQWQHPVVALANAAPDAENAPCRATACARVAHVAVLPRCLLARLPTAIVAGLDSSRDQLG